MIFNPLTIVTIIIAVAIIVVCSWYFNKDDKNLSNFQLLDISLGTLGIFFLLARVLGLIYYWAEISSANWTLLPVIQPSHNLVFFSTWPWLIFNITDGRFFFLEAIGAFILADLIFKFFHRGYSISNNNTYYRLGFLIPSLALTPFFIGALVNSYLAGQFIISLPLISLLIILLGCVMVVLTVRNKLSLYLTLFLLQIIELVALIVDAAPQANDLKAILFINAVFIIISLITIINELKLPKSNLRTKQTAHSYRVNRANQIK